MIINHNLPGANAISRMNANSVTASKSMEKLSSGMRINRAGDDAAGLAISEKMRGQIRGLDQASANAQDGISMIQTAEGALSETTSIIQRMRELSIQSSSDTNTADDRAAVQKEVTQLKAEIDRIGNTTEFNTTKLVDGSIGAKKAPGVDNAAVLTNGLGSATAGKYTGTVDFNEGTKKIADVTSGIDSATQSITVDGAKIDFKVTQAGLQGTSGDTTGAAFATYLQDQINEGIDAYNEKYNGSIDKVSVTAAGGAGSARLSIQSGSTGATSSISTTVATTAADNLWEIAGFNVSSAATLSDTGLDGVFTTAGAANAAAIKDSTTASFAAGTDTVKVDIGADNAAHASDITIQYANGGAAGAAWSGNTLTLTFDSGTTKASDMDALVKAATASAPTGVDMSKFSVTSTTTATGADSSASAITETGTPSATVKAGLDSSVVTIDGKAINVNWVNVGKNDPAKDDSMSTYASKIQTDINDSIAKYNATVPTADKVENVKVSVKDGSFVIQSGSSKETSSIKFDNSEAAKLLGLAGQSSASQGGGVDFQIGANAGQTMKITVGDMRTAALGIDKIDMSTKEGAQAATSLLDTALKTVSGQRADLGAFSNRLEHTINNLGTSSENLTSAESRIRDVDMAKEMSTFSKNNILSQAAQAMLAQANTQPQQVLQLLR